VKRRLCALLSAVAVLLALCACGSGGSTVIRVYRAVAPYYRTDGQVVEAEEYSVTPGVGLINTVIAQFNTAPADQRLQSPLGGVARILGYELSGGALRLEVSSGYAQLVGTDRMLADCCIALTFCAVDGVESVSVWSEGQELTPPLSADDIYLPQGQS
jgi:hypothetical protein